MGIEVPKVEVRFEHLSVEGEAYVGTRALPTLINSTLNAIEVSHSSAIFLITKDQLSSALYESYRISSRVICKIELYARVK